MAGSSASHPFGLQSPLQAVAHWLLEDNLQDIHRALVLTQGTEVYLASPSSVHGMVRMGLGELPLAAIALPQHQAVVGCKILPEPNILDLSNKLTTYFSSYLTAALYELQSLCRQSNLQAYIIGGQVRDILLARDHRFDVVDVDITVEGNAIESAQRIVEYSRNFKVEEIFPEFGTATLSYKDNIRFDLASTRQEHYTHCGALPIVDARGVPLQQDVIRRDFTINTLAMSVHHLGQVWDFTNGMADIETRTIKVLHPLSFYEDPSRILRAFKFATRLDFKLGEKTEALIEQFLTYGSHCYSGGGDRIRCELEEFTSLPENASKRQWFGLFRRQRVVKLANMTLPNNLWEAPATPLPQAAQQLLHRPPADWQQVALALELYHDRLQQIMEVAVAGIDEPVSTDEVQAAVYERLQHLRFLLHLWQLLSPLIKAPADLANEESIYRQTLKRLEITRHEREALSKAYALLIRSSLADVDDSTSPVVVVQVCQHQPVESLLMAALWGHAHTPERLDLLFSAIYRYERRLRHIKPLLNGDDLLALGVPRGEAIGQTLEALLFQKLLGRLATREEEADWVSNFCQDGCVIPGGSELLA